VQYNLLTPPIGWVSGSQDSSRQTSVPLYHGFKEVEENWTKHCSSGKKENVRNFLLQDLLLEINDSPSCALVWVAFPTFNRHSYNRQIKKHVMQDKF